MTHDTINTSTAVARLRGMDGTPHDSRYGGFFGEVADLIEAMQAEHDAALARVAELEAERAKDHLEIEIKVDVIERRIKQSAADYARITDLCDTLKTIEHLSNNERIAGMARAALAKESTP